MIVRFDKRQQLHDASHRMRMQHPGASMMMAQQPAFVAHRCATMETSHWMHSVTSEEYDHQYHLYLRQRLESEALEAQYHYALSTMFAAPPSQPAAMDCAMMDASAPLSTLQGNIQGSAFGIGSFCEPRKRSFGGLQENAQVFSDAGKRKRVHEWR